MTRTRPVCLALWAVLALLRPGPVWGEPDLSPRTYDCGVMSLYHLLRLEGRPTDLETIERHLPSSKAGQYSLKELRDAARACGLTLNGVRLPASGRPPSGPALVHLDRKPGGHFLLIRPVGHTGRLVQLLDSTRPPYVQDAETLYASPEWTGIALVPSRPNQPARIAGFMCALLGLALVVVSVRGRRSPTGKSVRGETELMP